MRVPEFIRAMLVRFHKRHTESREPDFKVGPPDDAYLDRWWVIPRNSRFNIYLHLVHHDDDDRALHDHPYWNCSIVVDGGYWEIHRNGARRWRAPGSVLFRRPETPHRLELSRSGSYRVKARTIFITGPRVREWGFLCPQGWRPWHEFVDPANPGRPRKGCE